MNHIRGGACDDVMDTRTRTHTPNLSSSNRHCFSGGRAMPCACSNSEFQSEQRANGRAKPKDGGTNSVREAPPASTPKPSTRNAHGPNSQAIVNIHRQPAGGGARILTNGRWRPPAAREVLLSSEHAHTPVLDDLPQGLIQGWLAILMRAPVPRRT